MDVIPNLLGEREVKCMSAHELEVLKLVIDDTIASHIANYMNAEAADTECVHKLKTVLGPTIESLTLHFKLREMGIIDLVARLTPEDVLASNLDLDDTYEKLHYLRDNLDKVKSHITPRTRDDYESFLSVMRALILRMSSEGITPTYPDTIERIKSNQFLFYVPNDKGHSTGMNVVFNKRRHWEMVMRGIEYDRYCNEQGIDYFKRRSF